MASGAHPGRLSCRDLAPTLGQGLMVLLLGSVQVVHVGRVVLAVVQLHDLRVDVRLQRAIVVRQVGEAVLVPGARGSGRRGQPPDRAERNTEDAASRHPQREPATLATPRSPHGGRRGPGPRRSPAHCPTQHTETP